MDGLEVVFRMEGVNEYNFVYISGKFQKCFVLILNAINDNSLIT